MKIKTIKARLVGVGSDSEGLEIDNGGAAYADSAWNNLSSQNSRIRGMKATNTTHTPAGLPYGTLFADFYVSTTTGYFWFLFSEPSAANASLVTLTGTAAFDATGSMVLPTNGDSITMVMDYFCIGHTAFQTAAPTVSMVSGVATVYDMTYQIDKNDGAGWKARFGMFPQLGAPVGFILANGLFFSREAADLLDTAADKPRGKRLANQAKTPRK